MRDAMQMIDSYDEAVLLDLRQALTEVLAEAEPVGTICVRHSDPTWAGKNGVDEFYVLWENQRDEPLPEGTKLFTHPAPSELAEAQGRIAELEQHNRILQDDNELLRTLSYRDERDELRTQLAAAQAALTEVRGCFEAAMDEGLLERLAELDVHDIGTLADLVHRRLMYAHAAAIATGQPAKDSSQ